MPALLAERLDAINRQRQAVEAGVLQAAYDAAEAQMQRGCHVLMVSGARWHPGVVGIVASRLRERFNRPACVAGLADGVLKGSGRSVPGHDLGAAVLAARQAGLLESGGGHAMAAGFRPGAGASGCVPRLPVRSPAGGRRCPGPAASACGGGSCPPGGAIWTWHKAWPGWRLSAPATRSR